MATVACPGCSRPISTAAKNCPHCQSPANDREYARQIGTCRACHNPIRRADHVSKAYYTEMVDGTSRTRSYTQTHPCNHCGDPNPLGVVDTSNIGAWIMMAVILLLGTGWMFA